MAQSPHIIYAFDWNLEIWLTETITIGFLISQIFLISPSTSHTDRILLSQILSRDPARNYDVIQRQTIVWTKWIHHMRHEIVESVKNACHVFTHWYTSQIIGSYYAEIHGDPWKIIMIISITPNIFVISLSVFT